MNANFGCYLYTWKFNNQAHGDCVRYVYGFGIYGERGRGEAIRTKHEGHEEHEGGLDEG